MILAEAFDALAAQNYFYRQLSEDGQYIYDSMYDYYYTDGKTGTLELSQFESTSSVLTASERAETLSDEATYAFSAFINDHPEVYWAKYIDFEYTGNDHLVSGVFEYSILDSVTVKITSDSKYYKAKYQKKYKKAVKKAVKWVRKNRKSKSKVDTLKAICRWIKKNTTYDNLHYNSTSSKYSYLYTAYGVFVKGSALCDGYSEALKVLCGEFGINCVIDHGELKNSLGTYEHAWNIVKLKNKWYYIDVTMYDTMELNDYFLFGTNFFGRHYTRDYEQFQVTDELEIEFSLPKVKAKKSYRKK